MKAKLIFKLPEEQQEFNRASKATDLALCIWDIEQYHRKVIKYDLESDPTLDYKTADTIFNNIKDIIHNYKIDTDDLIT